MSNKILYIDENDIKTLTTVQNNVNSKLITPFIEEAQILYIDELLGSALKTEMDNQILSGTTAITQNYLDLLNYIKPALVYWTWYESIPFNRAKFTDKGIVLKDSDNSTAISDQYEAKLAKTISNFAEKRMALLKRFMEDNEELYPLWRVRTNCEPRTDHKSQFFGGIQF